MKHQAATAAALADRFLSPGDTVLEIGAADGTFTQVFAERVGPTGSVVAVEPRPTASLIDVAQRLPWVRVFVGAVGAQIGAAVFYPDQSDSRHSALYRANVPHPGEATTVPLTTVDALVAGMPRMPRIIQVDAQGAEAAILRGASKTLRLPIVWVIEVWASGLMQAGASVADVVGPFQAHAFTPRSVIGSRLEWDDAQAYAARRRGPAHADFVMVPEDLMEADW